MVVVIVSIVVIVVWIMVVIAILIMVSIMVSIVVLIIIIMVTMVSIRVIVVGIIVIIVGIMVTMVGIMVLIDILIMVWIMVIIIQMYGGLYYPEPPPHAAAPLVSGGYLNCLGKRGPIKATIKGPLIKAVVVSLYLEWCGANSERSGTRHRGP